MQCELTSLLDQNSLEKVRQFLKANKLPYSDITLEGGLFFGYHDQDGRLIGSGGLEMYGEIALLRSIAVNEKFRGQLIGKKIVEDLLSKAKNLKVKTLYLLTETAHDFFLKKGFIDVPREKTPEVIKLSTEFSQVCPASAVVMKLAID
jgi:N-acetylglutamate synthase-like GNAT family acetyltransferase